MKFILSDEYCIFAEEGNISLLLPKQVGSEDLSTTGANVASEPTGNLLRYCFM